MGREHLIFFAVLVLSFLWGYRGEEALFQDEVVPAPITESKGPSAVSNSAAEPAVVSQKPVAAAPLPSTGAVPARELPPPPPQPATQLSTRPPEYSGPPARREPQTNTFIPPGVSPDAALVPVPNPDDPPDPDEEEIPDDEFVEDADLPEEDGEEVDDTVDGDIVDEETDQAADGEFDEPMDGDV